MSNGIATHSDVRPSAPLADLSLNVVKACLGFVQRGAKRLVQLSKREWETLERLAVQLKDASEVERTEIIETMLEVVFPDDTIGGVASRSRIDRKTQIKVREYQKSIGTVIRQRRKARRMTQQDLAKKAGLPQSHVSRIECGQHVPSDLTIEKFAKALGVKPSEIDPGFPDE
jgi:ribosome-binding protein aMBF1 (putative translation factor)